MCSNSLPGGGPAGPGTLAVAVLAPAFFGVPGMIDSLKRRGLIGRWARRKS